MFMHNKKLQYTVRVSEPNPVLGTFMLEQFGGPDGELAAAMRYFSQGLAEDDAGRKDLLMDIATEELSHLEIIGSIVTMLCKGAKSSMAEGALSEADLYKSINGGGISHTESILFGGGPAFVNSSGVPFSGFYIDTRGEPTVDLRSNIAAEARAKIVYERLINITGDPGVKDALTFLMTREVAHQKSFEKALYSIENNFPPGKLPGDERFASLYVNTSPGADDVEGPWNSGDEWQRIDDPTEAVALDGGNGMASVKLSKTELASAKAAAKRGASDPNVNPTTGADLGAGPGAGRTKEVELTD
ncbi:MAG: manganese catalase family protein [Sphingomicrobium sp.]|nr:manganese catalase family protein [Sphingomonadales bacterium]